MNKRLAVVGPRLPEALGNLVRKAFIQDSYTPLVESLEDLLAVKVGGLIIYGSRAARPTGSPFGVSDVDLLVLADEPVTGGVFGLAGDVELDVHLDERRSALTGDRSLWALFAGGRVVFDRRPPELATWIEALSCWRRENPNPWSAAQIIKDRAWADRIVARLARAEPGSEKEMVLHEARLLAMLPTLHAQARGRHPTSITRWWTGLAEDDPPFASRLGAYLSNRTSKVNFAALAALIDSLYAGKRSCNSVANGA